MLAKLCSVLLLSLISQTFCGNVGIGFSTSGPYDFPLSQMKSKNVYIFKTWDIQADLLNQMEITYAQVCSLISADLVIRFHILKGFSISYN